MKPIKLILIFFLCYALCAMRYAFAAGEDITVVGDTRAKTVSLESAALPVSGSEGEIRYNPDDDKLYVWVGTPPWKPLSANRNVATKIVGTKNLVDPAKASLDYSRADYICDGTDDQQEINQAILDIFYSATSPVNKAKAGVVYILDGTYNISDKISPDISYTRPDTGGSVTITTPGIIMQSDISLIGAGAGTVLKLVSGTRNVNAINAVYVNSILISQLKLDGNNKTGSNNQGIWFKYSSNCTINKVWVEKFVYKGIYFAWDTATTLSSKIIITENYISSNGEDGIKTAGPALKDSIICGNDIQSNSGNGVNILGGSGNIISNNNVKSNGTIGINLEMYSANSVISNNKIQSNLSGLQLLSKNCTAFGNSITSNTRYGISLPLRTEGNVVLNNIIGLNGYQGIVVSGSTGYEPKNNIVSANVIYDNGSTANYDGIKLKNALNNSIFSNYIFDSSGTGYGINLDDSSCVDNYLASNYVTGTGFTAKIKDLGINTKYTGKEKITLEQASGQNPGSGGTITPDSASYIPLDPSSTYSLAVSPNKAIEDGKADGDLLILENRSANTITIPNSANTKLGANRALAIYDNVVLIWKADVDPAKSNWLELSYWDN